MSGKQGAAGGSKFTIWSDESAKVLPTVTSEVSKLKADALEAFARFKALSRGTSAAAPVRRSPSPTSSGSRSPSPLSALFTSSWQNSSPPRAIYMPTAKPANRKNRTSLANITNSPASLIMKTQHHNNTKEAEEMSPAGRMLAAAQMELDKAQEQLVEARKEHAVRLALTKSLTKNLQENERKIQENERKIQENEHKIEKNKEEIKENKEEIEKNEAELAKRPQGKIKSLKATIKSLETGNASLRAANEDLHANNRRLNRDIERQSKENDVLRQKITESSTTEAMDLANIDSKIQDLDILVAKRVKEVAAAKWEQYIATPIEDVVREVIKDLDTASKMNEVKSFITAVKKNNIDVRFGVGADKISAPIEIFQEAFSVACDTDAVEPTATDADHMDSLLHEANKYHSNEAAMVQAIIPELGRLLGCTLKTEDTMQEEANLPKRSDAALRMPVSISDKTKTLLNLLLETKYDIGSKGNAMLQAIASYCHRLKENDSYGARLHQPAFLLSLMGQLMVIMGAVYEPPRTIHVQVLSILSLERSAAPGAYMKSLRALLALGRGLKVLQASITRQAAAANLDEPAHFLKPFPIQGLTYISKREGSGLVYNGTYTDGDKDVRVVVKFTPQPYGAEVHAKAAESGFAPRVLTTQRVWESAWYATVMEEVTDASTWTELIKDSHTDLAAIKDTIVAKMRAAVDSLGDSMVHGDISGNNVLVRCKGSDVGIFLIDFEWSGRAGVAKYPCSARTKRFQTITKEDDLDAVKMLAASIDTAVAARAMANLRLE